MTSLPLRMTLSALALLTGLSLAWPAPSWAPNCPSGCRPVTSSVHLWLDDTLQLTLTDSTVDEIPLAGPVHVVAHATPTAAGEFAVRVLVNLHDVTGVGQATGARYVAVGAERFEALVGPPDEVQLFPTFPLERLAPPDSVTPPDPYVTLRIRLPFQPDGTLLEPTVGVHVP